jgi:hypothetical protein
MSNSSGGKGQKNAKQSAKRDATRVPEGVLANLPRTRPQRPSARRDAARRLAAAKATPTAAKATPTQASARKQATAKRRPAKSAVKPLQDPAPRQGFDSVSGPVQPPGGVELLASAAELAGELAKTGLSTGGRLLKDVLSRLPLN